MQVTRPSNGSNGPMSSRMCSRRRSLCGTNFTAEFNFLLGGKKTAFTFEPAPPPTNVKVKKSKEKRGGESVVIDRVEFADRTIWRPLAKESQVKPANN